MPSDAGDGPFIFEVRTTLCLAALAFGTACVFLPAAFSITKNGRQNTEASDENGFGKAAENWCGCQLSYGKKYVGTWRSVPCSPTEEGFGAMKEWTTPLDGLEPGEKYLICAHHRRPPKMRLMTHVQRLKMFGRELQACGRGIRRRAWSLRRRPARGGSGQTGARRLRRRGRGRASPTPARPWAVSNTVQTNPQLIVEVIQFSFQSIELSGPDLNGVGRHGGQAAGGRGEGH